MQQMYHCKQCRADAIGTLGNDVSIEFNACHKAEKPEIISEANEVSTSQKFQVAVATKSGMIVDQHFGQVSELYVYEYFNGNAKFIEKRNVDKYCNGSQDCDEKEDKISMIINTISDCDAVIAMRIGDSPKMKLNQKGIRVFTTYDKIEDSVIKVAAEMSVK